MIEKLKKIGLENYEFVNGVDGQSKKILNKFEQIKNKTRITNSGHLGCILSHIKVIKKAIKNKQPKVVKEVAEKVAPKLLKWERSQRKILEFNIKAVKDLDPNLTGDALDEKSLAMFNRSMSAKNKPVIDIKQFKALKTKYEL